jgi:hypothetical protein
LDSVDGGVEKKKLGKAPTMSKQGIADFEKYMACLKSDWSLMILKLRLIQIKVSPESAMSSAGPLRR